MKRRVALPFIALLAPLFASADGNAALSAKATDFMEKVFSQIINPIIVVGFTLSIVYLAWSVFQYTVQTDKLDKEKLKSSLIYGVVGVFIMASVFGIMRIIATTVTGSSDVVTNNV